MCIRDRLHGELAAALGITPEQVPGYIAAEVAPVSYTHLDVYTSQQASFVELFEGDDAKIKAVEADSAAALGFEKGVPVSGQTDSRKVDYNVLSALSGVAQSAMKFGNDMRPVSYTHLLP